MFVTEIVNMQTCHYMKYSYITWTWGLKLLIPYHCHHSVPWLDPGNDDIDAMWPRSNNPSSANPIYTGLELDQHRACRCHSGARPSAGAALELIYTCFIQSLIQEYLDGTNNQSCSRKAAHQLTKSQSFLIPADNLATLGARTSAAIVLTKNSCPSTL